MIRRRMIVHGDFETLVPNSTYTIVGAAWSGEAEDIEIVVSTDGGESWTDAKFIDPAGTSSWRQWTFDWTAPVKPGSCTLRSEASDATRRVQPERDDPNHDTYVINYPLPIEVLIYRPHS
jgi:Mo-co oxidoreductase dimerisation domain